MLDYNSDFDKDGFLSVLIDETGNSTTKEYLNEEIAMCSNLINSLINNFNYSAIPCTKYNSTVPFMINESFYDKFHGNVVMAGSSALNMVYSINDAENFDKTFESYTKDIDTPAKVYWYNLKRNSNKSMHHCVLYGKAEPVEKDNIHQELSHIINFIHKNNMLNILNPDSCSYNYLSNPDNWDNLLLNRC